MSAYTLLSITYGSGLNQSILVYILTPMLSRPNQPLLQKGRLALEKFGEVCSGNLQGSLERPRTKSYDWIALENSGEKADLVELIGYILFTKP
jgi:hypothetical protein